MSLKYETSKKHFNEKNNYSKMFLYSSYIPDHVDD